MILVPGLDEVKVMWIRLEQHGFVLFGFLLYTNSDRALVDYMKDGIIDLDYLSGEECAVFAIESPSKEWISYTRQSNHTWWDLFGEELVDTFARKQEATRRKLSLLERNIIENNQNCTIIVGDENVMSLQQLIEPETHLLYNRAEALKVAKHFGLKIMDIPCLIFFKDLDSRVIWKTLLRELKTQTEIKDFFREFFESSDFKSLLHTPGVPT